MNKTLIKKYGFILILIYGVVYVFLYGLEFWNSRMLEKYVEGDAVQFNLESGHYDKTLKLKLSKNIEFPFIAHIYYTTNGDDPRVNGILYEGSITLEENDSIAVYPVKAVVGIHGRFSNVTEKTYIITEEKDNEYDIDIISISCNHDDLYNYYTGIMVAGVTYDQNVENGVTGFIPGNYSNRGGEWIKDCHITMVDKDGQMLLDQNGGMEISGNTSVIFPVKSLKLYADRSYDPNNNFFKISLDNSDTDFLDYSYVTKYKSMRLRSGSQDLYFGGNIRSAVVSRLAVNSNFDGCSGTRRSLVFLNGEFYGIMDIQQNYSDSYLSNRFGLPNSDLLEKVKGGEPDIFFDLGLNELFEQDLNIAENRNLLEEKVDMDNYLLYYALEIMCNNTDWPVNSYEVWRYIGDEIADNPYTDGRYRFLMFDMDMSFNTDLRYEFFDGALEDTFVSIMNNEYRAKGNSFINVMKSKYYRDKFITIICDLTNTSFSKESLELVLSEEDEKISYFRKIYYTYDMCNTSENESEQMKKAVLSRPTEVKNDIETYFNLDEKYTFNLNVPKGVMVSWNNMKIYEGEQYTNDYYKGVDLYLRADANPDYEFEYWLINDKKVYGETIILESDKFPDVVDICPVVSKKKDSCLVINKISAEGGSDWIELSNYGDESIEIGNYYLTDNQENLFEFQLPDLFLGSGESIIIHCKNDSEYLGEYMCNFNISAQEKLILSDGVNIVDYVYVPIMDSKEVYMRHKNSNNWVFAEE